MEWTNLHNLMYFLFGISHLTDYKVSDEEKAATIKIAKEYFEESVDFDSIYREVQGEYLKDIGFPNYTKEGLLKAQKQTLACAKAFVTNSTGDATHNLSFLLKDSISLFKSDGDFSESEKNLIDKLAGHWDVDKDWLYDCELEHEDNLDEIKELFKLEEDDSVEDISKREEKVISPTLNHAQPNVYEIISKGIQKSKVLPFLPYIKQELKKKKFKNLPKHDAWLYIDEVSINEMKGFLFVNMDGFYSNCMNPEEITFIMTWDNIYNLQLFDSHDSERKDMAEGLINLLLSCDQNENPDEAMVLSLFIEGYSSKTNSPFSVIKSIYDNIWKKMIDKYRGKPIIWGSHIDWFTKEGFASKEEFISFYTDEASEKRSNENPEAYAFVKAVSSKGANMQDILNKYELIFDDHINFADEDGYTAMHYACWDNKPIILQMLIDFGANPNVLSPTNESPINMAVVSGHLDIVKFFVDYDVEMELNIDWENRNKTENPFHSKKGSTLIRDALLNQHWDIFDVLIDGIAPNLDVLTEPCSVGFEGETNFFLAIEKFYQKKNIDYDKERLETIRTIVESNKEEKDTPAQKINNEEEAEQERTGLDRIVFFLLSFAHIADGEKLEKVEITKVRNIVKSLLQDTSSQSDSLFEKAANWFMEEMTKVEWNVRDDSFQAILNKCITSVEDTFWKSNNPEKRLFVNQVIDLANVDGTIGDGEIAWIERLCAGIDIEIPNILDKDPERRWDVEEEDFDTDKGYPMITVRVFKDKDGDDTEKQKLVKEYMMNWHEPTEEYNGRMGITARIPDFFQAIDKSCPKWTSDEITNIKNYITKYKVIPTLRYAPEEFNNWTKQVWWLAPFVFIDMQNTEVATWLFIDKNGFHAAKSDNEGFHIFSWDIITDTETEWLEKNLVMLTLYGEHNDQDIELRICEFVSEGNGSYLEVIESIYSVYEKTIEASRGGSTWSHGAGGEGYEGFDNPKELLDEKKWKAVEPTNPSLYGSSFEEIKTVEESTSKEDNDTSQTKVTMEMIQQGFDGKGLFEAPDGLKYEGDFKAGRFSGKGKLIWPDGENYDGDWKDGNPNGKGIYNFTNGDVYVGEFKNGEKSGSGKFTHGSGDWEGDVYEGEFKNDQRSGHGVITFGSGEFKGEKYDGQWKDGKRNGKGTYYFTDGTSFMGTWKDGECVEKEVELKTENKVLSKDASIWEIIQHEFINLDKESVVKKDFSEMILKKYPHIKKGTLSAQISIQVINKRGRTNYAQCSKERVCGDNKYDFLFENDDKTLCKYDKSKHGIWEIYKREDSKLDVRIFSK